MSRDLVYYVAVTLDGRIAGPGGEIDFFPQDPELLAAMNVSQPETVPTAFREALGLAGASRYPVLAGAGLPLIDGVLDPAAFTVTRTRTFASGADVVTCRRVRGD